MMTLRHGQYSVWAAFFTNPQLTQTLSDMARRLDERLFEKDVLNAGAWEWGEGKMLGKKGF